MTEEQRLNKNKAIGLKRQETLKKRQSQVCHVYKCKIQANKLSKLQKEQLDMMFVEAKWIYNAMLAWSNESEENNPWNYKIGNTVLHYDKDRNLVETELKFIHSQMKQCVQSKLCSSIKTLSTLKQRGHKVGRLKFISEFNTLHIKQISNTSVKDGKYVKIPGIKGKVRINGLDQFVNIEGIEVACFDLVKNANGYFVHFCTYQPKRKTTKNGKTIGLDFGCSTTLTTSEGNEYNIKIKESDRLKRLQRKLARQVGFNKGEKKSNNFNRTRNKIRKEYIHITNKKNDLANKILAELKRYDIIVIQDEQLANWHKTHSKSVQYSILGRLKSKLIALDNTKVVNKYCPTTKLCTKCGARISLSLYDRTFKCECGECEDRDIHAAKNMVWLYENNVGMERTKLKHVELMQQLSLAISKQNLEALAAKHEGTTL